MQIVSPIVRVRDVSEPDSDQGVRFERQRYDVLDDAVVKCETICVGITERRRIEHVKYAVIEMVPCWAFQFRCSSHRKKCSVYAGRFTSAGVDGYSIAHVER